VAKRIIELLQEDGRQSYAAIAKAVGLSEAAVVEALARLSTAAFAATIALCAWAFAASDRRARRALAIAAVLCSSLVYHSTAGFGEALAAATVAAAIVAAIKQRPLLIVITVALAAIGKDTLLPFVVALGFLCARREGRLLPPRRMVVALSAGAVREVAIDSELDRAEQHRPDGA